MIHRVLLIISFLGAVSLNGASLAQDGLPLTIVSKEGEEHSLHLDDLDAMEQVEFSTTTLWTEGEAVFSGVAVYHLLEVLELDGAVLRMSALNDYAVEMPISDLEEDAPIIATRVDGAPMPIREKGPFWVMYPFDSKPEYKTEVNYARAVWQLKSLSLPE